MNKKLLVNLTVLSPGYSLSMSSINRIAKMLNVPDDATITSERDRVTFLFNKDLKVNDLPEPETFSEKMYKTAYPNEYRYPKE